MNLSSESYTENCVGAIDSELVSELKMPVDIKDSSSITFDDEYAYGIVNGKDHNGVDLNEKTVGVTLGSDGFSVETGKVASISDSKEDTSTLINELAFMFLKVSAYSEVKVLICSFSKSLSIIFYSSKLLLRQNLIIHLNFIIITSICIYFF